MKTTDKYLLRIIVYLYSFLIIYAIVEKFLLSIAIFIPFVITVECTSLLLKKHKKIPYEKIKRYLSFMGNDYVLTLLNNVFENKSPIVYKDKLVINVDGQKALIYPAVKFSSLGLDDMKNAIHIAEEIGANKIYLLFCSIDRKALTLQEYTTIPVEILPFKKFCKKIVKQGFTLPSSSKKFNAEKLKILISYALNEKVARRLIISALITAALSFITPLKNYYRLVGFLQLAFALICILFPSEKTKTDILD